MIFRKRRRTAAHLFEQNVDEAPMTPMIDIVFQLLIFFMLTMNFLRFFSFFCCNPRLEFFSVFF